MFSTPYNKKIKDEIMAIDRAYIAHSKKVSTKGLLNVSASGNKIGGSLPTGMSASIGRPIGGAISGGADRQPLRATGYQGNQPLLSTVIRNSLHLVPINVLRQWAANEEWMASLTPVLRQRVLDRLNDPQVVNRQSLGSRLPHPDPNVGRGHTSGGRKASKWIDHVKAFSAKKGISYSCAMSMPECKESYKKVGGVGWITDAQNKADAAKRMFASLPKVPAKAAAPAAPAAPAAAPVGGKHSSGKFKQVGAKLVAEANAELDPVSSPTAATVPPKVGGARTKGASDKKPRKPSKWIDHVKAFSAKKGISYSCAMSMPECKAAYRAPAEAPKKKRLVRKVKNIE